MTTIETTTQATTLQKNHARRAILSQQIAKYDQELEQVVRKIAAERSAAMAKGKDLPYPPALIAKRDAAAHARAALVKEDQQLRIESVTLGRSSRQYADQLDAIEAQIAEWADVLDVVEDLKDKLSRIDATMIRSPQYQGVPQNSVRGVLFFLAKPTELLERAASLRARVHEIGLPEED
jgi:hypothetical protein